MKKTERESPCEKTEEQRNLRDHKEIQFGDIHVNVEFSDSEKSLGECLWNVLCRFEGWK